IVHDLCVEIPLEHLQQSDVADYLSAEFPGADLPSGLAGLIHRHSGGNALFMTAIVRDMVDKGVVAEDGGRWTLTRRLANVAPEVPASLQEMLEAQFTRLTASEQRILSHASVAGGRFSGWGVPREPGPHADGDENHSHRVGRRGELRGSA